MPLIPKASAFEERWKRRDSLSPQEQLAGKKAGCIATRAVATQRAETSLKSRFSVSYLIAAIWELIVC